MISLRSKIAVLLGVVVAVATLAVGLVSLNLTRDRLLAEIDRSLVEGVRRVPGIGRGGEPELPVRGPLALYEVQLLDGVGDVRASSFPLVVEPGAGARSVVGRPGVAVVETVSANGTPYRIRTVGVARGAVQVSRSLEETERVLASLRRRTALVVILVSGLAAALGALIAGRVTASLRRLTTTAETVASTGRLDITSGAHGDDEVGRLGASFDRMLEALGRSKAEQQRLVEDVGHELRTPLTSLRTNVDVLRRHPDLPGDERTRVVADLSVEIDELVGLVEEIVTVSTGAASDEPFRLVALDVLAAEVADRFERRTGRTVQVEAAAAAATVSGVDGSVVVGQSASLQRAVANLLDNAHKFDRSDAPVVITVDRGRVEVLDRGPGVPDHEVDRIFDRFHRSDEARSKPGSGLGLAIVRDVVERHGGSVSARNRADGGAAIGFEIPVAHGVPAVPGDRLSPDSRTSLGSTLTRVPQPGPVAGNTPGVEHEETS